MPATFQPRRVADQDARIRRIEDALTTLTQELQQAPQDAMADTKPPAVHVESAGSMADLDDAEPEGEIDGNLLVWISPNWLNLMQVDGSGTPTAYLHLQAGTAAAGTASLKIPAGVVLTTPEAGAIELDSGGELYFTRAAARLKVLLSTLLDGTSIVGGTSTGTQLLTAANQKLGVMGAAPIARPAAYTLAGSATRTFPADPSVSYTGIDNAQPATPYASVADLNTLRGAVSALEGVVRQLTQDLGEVAGYGFLDVTP